MELLAGLTSPVTGASSVALLLGFKATNKLTAEPDGICAREHELPEHWMPWELGGLGQLTETLPPAPCVAVQPVESGASSRRDAAGLTVTVILPALTADRFTMSTRVPWMPPAEKALGLATDTSTGSAIGLLTLHETQVG